MLFLIDVLCVGFVSKSANGFCTSTQTCVVLYVVASSWSVRIMVYKTDQSSSFKIAAYVITENACTAKGKSPYIFDAKHKYSHSVHHFSSQKMGPCYNTFQIILITSQKNSRLYHGSVQLQHVLSMHIMAIYGVPKHVS